MAHGSRCPDDGYPQVLSAEFPGDAPELRCTNPWHPHHPGPCPRCQRTGHPGNAVGSPDAARCDHCGFQWHPFPSGTFWRG